MTKSKLQPEEFEEQAALHALGILPSPEAHEFEAALPAASEAELTTARQFDAVVAQLGFSVEEAAPTPQVRQNLLAQIAREAQAPAPRPAAATGSSFIEVFAREENWVKITDGVFSKTLFVEPTNGYVTSLLKIDPGHHLPNHRHHGNEQCIVLSGEFSMNGTTYGPGDFTVALTGSRHVRLFTETGVTVLLVSPPDYEFGGR